MIKLKADLVVSEGGKTTKQLGFENDLNGEVTLADFLAFTKQSLIVIADSALKEEQAAGFDPTPVVTVDGITGKPEADVKPFGKIEYTARADITAILQDTFESLFLKSPRLTGTYQASHYVFLNGNQVASDQSSFEAWINKIANGSVEFKDADLIRFVNIQPYARKLERLGVTADRQQTRTVQSRNHRRNKSASRVLVPNGDYYVTARSIRNKYKQNSIIRFEFISGSSLGIEGSFAPKRGKPGRAYLYPSILISVKEGGIL